ncbi:MAG: MFS transporter [Alphaproteobacteria bacterium]
MNLSPRSQKWWIVGAMASPVLLICIDFYGIIVALPTIGDAFGADSELLEWTINGFFLGFAAPLVAVGRLADIVGRRRIVLLGSLLFALASAFCGFAEDAAALIGGRALQGIASALMFSASLSIVSNAFTKEERGHGIGVWSAIGLLGSAIGPVVGGLLTEDLSWRWFFYVNLPVAAAGIALTLLVVPESRDESAPRAIDLPGFVLVTAAFVGIVLGLQLSSRLGFGSPVVLGSLAVGALLLALFVVVEERTANPLVQFTLFRGHDYLGGSAVGFIANYAFASLTFFVTLYLQDILRASPDRTGAVFMTFSVPLVATSLLVGWAQRLWGVRLPMAVGMVLVAASFLFITGVTPSEGVDLVVAALVISGFGQALAYNISTNAAMSAIPEEKAGAASGVLSSLRMLGLVMGVAVTGALFNGLEQAKLEQDMTAAGVNFSAMDKVEIRGLLSGTHDAKERLSALAPDLANRMEAIVGDAFVHALTISMVVSCLVTMAGVGACFLVRAPAPKRGQHTDITV